MPTKTEYREYIASEEWQMRRRDFLEYYDSCNRCELPRYLAVIAYDQDLHVHHRHYASVGYELDADLEALCRRCHEIETFGSSNLHAPRQVKCIDCNEHLTFDSVARVCNYCKFAARLHRLLRLYTEQERETVLAIMCPRTRQ